MKRNLLQMFSLCLFCALTTMTAVGQSNNEEKNELSVWGGIAPDISSKGSHHSTYVEVGLRYSRRLAASRHLDLKYTIDAIPLAILNYERELFVQLTPTTTGFVRSKTTAYGVSVTPIGFQLNFLRRKKIQPFFSGGVGMIVFNKPVPDDRTPLRPNQVGRRFNFTPQAGFGIEFLTDSKKSYTVGYKFHHISNASTGKINPGFDQNYFYFGYTFRKW